MYDFVAKHKKAIMIGLFLLIIPPFALFGVDSYFRGIDRSQSVAVVGDYSISQNEFTRSLRERQDALRRMLGGQVDASLLESAELRFSVVEQLIRERLLVSNALRLGLTVTDAQLSAVINEVPAFRDGDKFDYERYRQILRSQDMTPLMFEGRMRQEMLTQQLSDMFNASNFVPRAVAAHLVRISGQQREVSVYTIPADRFVAQVKLEPEAIRKYYDGQQDEFRVPEQVRIEYVVLSADVFIQQAQVSAEEVRKVYEGRRNEFETRETRQASHILILADAAGPAEERKKALAKAQAIYEQVRKNPASFAEVAKAESQDPGSAAKGGDLGAFSRGAMVPAFDNAVFDMKVGEISAPVETQYGYHVIRLAAIRPAQGKSFEEVRAQIEAELRKQVAGKKFAEAAEAFSNKAFEDSESLKGAAEVARAAIHQSGWITRGGASEAQLNNPRLLQAVFSDEVLKNRRNTEPVEVAPSTLIAARLIEHKPSTVRPFEDVKAGIEKKLVQNRASQLAAQEGRDRLGKLRKGEDAQVAWGAPQLIGRTEGKSLGEVLLRQAFRADTSKMPSYTGIENPQGGYTLMRVTRVVESDKPEIEKQNKLADALQQVLGQEDFSAYVASLKQRSKVKIQKDLIEKKQ